MDYDVVPYLFLKGTLVLELIAFLTSHMIDSRDITTLHEGIFRRCIYPSKAEAGTFNCLWWSADTYNTDRGSLKFVTILTFLSLFLLGFTCIYAVLSYYYRELRERARNFNYSMAIANAVNVLLLLLILIIYTFVYATDTRAIGGGTASLVFSWSYYLLYGALATNILSTIFFLYNPLREQK